MKKTTKHFLEIIFAKIIFAIILGYFVFPLFSNFLIKERVWEEVSVSIYKKPEPELILEEPPPEVVIMPTNKKDVLLVIDGGTMTTIPYIHDWYQITQDVSYESVSFSQG